MYPKLNMINGVRTSISTPRSVTVSGFHRQLTLEDDLINLKLAFLIKFKVPS